MIARPQQTEPTTIHETVRDFLDQFVANERRPEALEALLRLVRFARRDGADAMREVICMVAEEVT